MVWRRRDGPPGGAGPAERLRDAAAIMDRADGFGGWWLETVLSWPASG